MSRSVLIIAMLTVGCIDSPESESRSQRAVECEESCAVGETRCEREDEIEVFWTCVQEETSDGCTLWKSNMCGLGSTCSANGCDCETDCEVGEVDCTDPFDSKRCVEIDGCRSWVSDCTEINQCEMSGRDIGDACSPSACELCSL